MSLLKKIEKFFDYKIKKITEYPLVKLKDQIADKKIDQVIPPIVYQTWENNEFGKTHYKEIIKFRNINNNLNFKLFDKNARDEYMKNNWAHHKIYEVYTKSKFGVMESDIFRHCILYQNGGYYFDISKGTSAPITSLHNRDSEALISNEPVDCIIPPDKEIFSKLKHPHNNFLTWGLGFKSNHPIPLAMINSIVDDYIFYIDKIFKEPKLAILSLTATGQFTKVVRNYILNEGIDKTVQSGIYFNNKGIFSMKGCRVRHHLVPSYADIRDKKII